MDILPILSTLRRNKVGALLIGLQIALTLAIVCNALSIIQQRLQQMERPTGIDEANIFTMQNQWATDSADKPARLKGDLAALRSLPGVIDANAVATYPLGGGEVNWGLKLKPNQRYATANANLYFTDDHGLATYGFKLLGGRWFHADEVGELYYYQAKFPPTVVVTQELAKEMFPAGHALGQVIYFSPTQSSRIIGIIDRAQSPVAANEGDRNASEASAYIPVLPIGNTSTYVVRTRPGQQAAMMRAAQDVLYNLTSQRIIQNVRPFSETRSEAYRTSRATAVMLGVVSALLLTITGFGVVGLTMYWVTQRRRQIGMRRALGARKLDVLSYFQTENLLIVGAGCTLGIALGLAGNAWLVSTLELIPMGVSYICIGALIVVALCQAAVLWPALRAASISPASATRGL